MKRFPKLGEVPDEALDLRIVEQPIPDHAREHRDVRLLMVAGAEQEVGRIDLVDGRPREEGPFMRVKFIQTRGTFQRRKVATKLYEAAAKLACERFGLPLASDTTRYAGAEGFWAKQRRLGRARCVDMGPLSKTEDWCHRYVLACPPPVSLAGRRSMGLAPNPRPGPSWRTVGVLGGLLGLTIAISLWLRRKANEPIPGKQMPDASKVLGPPLAAPLRSMTPNGYHNAPRWLLPGGGTTGNRAKAPPGAKVHHVHEGADLQGKQGESVLAVGDGIVTHVYPPGGEACLIGLRVDLGDGRFAVYCDMGKVTVTAGSRVHRGDKVGEVHARGFVHIAIKDRSGKALDPAFLIPYRGSYV